MRAKGLRLSGPIVLVACDAIGSLHPKAIAAEEPRQFAVSAANGMRLVVAEESTDPELRVVLPGRPSTDGAIRILFPEHVTAVQHGDSTAVQLYVFRPGRRGEGPEWRVIGRSLEYERDLGRGVHMRARATLEEDGVRVPS